MCFKDIAIADLKFNAVFCFDHLSFDAKAFLDGNAPDRLCEPMKQYIESKGGQVLLNCPVARILTAEGSLSVAGVELVNGTVIIADEYVSAMPVDVFKRLVPGIPYLP